MFPFSVLRQQGGTWTQQILGIIRSLIANLVKLNIPIRHNLSDSHSLGLFDLENVPSVLSTAIWMGRA